MTPGDVPADGRDGTPAQPARSVRRSTAKFFMPAIARAEHTIPGSPAEEADKNRRPEVPP
jgi:hypothetical protein